MQVSTNGTRQIDLGIRDCRDPGAIAWNYTREETIADLAVHVAGLCFGFVATTVLLSRIASHAATTDVVAASIYASGLLSMLTLSAAYNLWPTCPMKWWLRRFDHSAIYVLIAATYTPFALHMKAGPFATDVLVAMWCVAALGVAIKLALPGRLDNFSIAVCATMGWSGIILLGSGNASIPFAAYRFLVTGGALLTFGVVFHLWQSLRYQNAIWHVFVLLGIACHYAAVLNVVLS